MNQLATVFGINNYPGFSNDLRGCVWDAKNIASELYKRGWEKRNVALMLDAQCHEDNQKRALEEMRDKAKPGDLVVIADSSHGAQVDGKESDHFSGTIVSYDFDFRKRLGITDWYMGDYLSGYPEGVSILLYLDCCFAGEHGDKRFDFTGVRKQRFLPNPAFMPLRRVRLGVDKTWADIRANVIVMAACASNETSSEDFQFGHYCGAFTFRFLEVLRRDICTASHISGECLNLLRHDNFDQTPTLYSFGPNAGTIRDVTLPTEIK